MPVDLSIPNSIIAAFSAGTQERRSSEELKLEKERLKQQRELEEQRLSQQHEHETAQIDLLKQAHELSKLTETQQLAQKYLETGVPPAGSSIERGSSYIPPSTENTETGIATQAMPISTSLGLSPDQIKLNIPNLGSTILPTPEKYAKQIGEQGILKEAPKLKLQADLQKQITDRQLMIESLKEESAYQRALEVEKLRANATIRAAQIRGQEARENKLDKVISPQEQRDIFGLQTFDPTLTYATATSKNLNLIKPLTPSQQDRLNALNEIERNAIDLDNSLKSIGGYNKYYSSWGGYLTEPISRITGGEKDPALAHIRDTAGKLQNLITTLSAGKTLSKTEQSMVEAHAPSASHIQTPETAESKIQDLIKGSRIAKVDLLKESQPSNQRKVEEWYRDPNDNNKLKKR